MKVGVIGVGYVGLVTGTGFSEMGNDVICVDVDQKKINGLKDGIIPIYEPGLKDLVIKNQQAGRLQFTTDLKLTVENSDILFIAVGTPSDKDGKADLKYVLQVAEQIGETINDYKVVVTKSTVPVGTNAKVKKVIQECLENRDLNKNNFDVASNPEFLKEGAAIEDFMRPDRIVIGVESDKSKQQMDNLYEPFVRNGHPIYFMDIPSAEMTKYAANAMLATKISFINEISRLCEEIGADVTSVRKGIGSDSRIGFDFIYAGLGYGGSCFPKDVKALYNTGKEFGQEMKMLEAVESINQTQRNWFTQKILNHFDGDVSNKTFAIWGLAFKPGTDDMREAPAVDIINTLTDKGARVFAYDPVATDTAKEAIGENDKVQYFSSQYDVFENADAMILLTEWREFRKPDFDRIKGSMSSPTVFDGRNQYDPAAMKEEGFDYISIGRNLPN